MLTAALLMLANTMLFSLRLNGGGSFPKPLTAEEEREYLARMEQGDRAARDALIERNLRLVAHVVKKYYCTQSNQEDLLSIGTIGLIKGISTFQPSKGARLATYAARCIENEILMYFRSQKKLQGEVSLADSIDTDKEGNALQLMDVVGEIVITESMVTASPDLRGLKLDNFTKSARQLRKLTDELQDVSMSLRMVPVLATFQKMQRIVRDMGKKLGKRARLTLIGENTEVDKTIVDSIGDPLMHIVRNSMDHGIEDTEEERIAAGKDPAKTPVRTHAVTVVDGVVHLQVGVVAEGAA